MDGSRMQTDMPRTGSSSDPRITKTGDPALSAVKAQVTIQNRLGLHARPAMSFVDTASGFRSSVKVTKGKQVVDGKSIMQLMMLAATRGTELAIEAEGPDAEDAIGALLALVESGFDED